jgi:acetylglutamate kinase
MGSPATEMAVPHVASRGMATTGTDGADVLPDVARALHDSTVVLKYGGSAVDHGGREEEFGRDVARLQASGIKPVVVHGGGPQISDLMRRFGKTPRFVDGMRVTDAETMDLVEMVLVGKIGEAIVGLINQEGGRAIGLSGKDADMLLAHRHRHRLPTGEEVDLGMVGDIDRVDTEPVRLLAAHGFAPVIAPIAVGQSGETYNVNADLAAGAIAAALGAAVLVHLTDVPGVRDGDGRIATMLTCAETEQLIRSGAIQGGMIPKVESALRALRGGVERVRIVDARMPHGVLLGLVPALRVGTEIIR